MNNKINEWILQFAAVVGAAILPVKPLMLGVGILVLMDMILGVWAAKKRREKITSKKLRNTVTKGVAYQLGIITGFMLDSIIQTDNVLIARAVASLVGIVEAKSAFENLHIITGVNVWTAILEKMKPAQSTKDEEKPQ